ncbi:hypothetical protein IJX73_02495 [bacterium]|nr:hypothetical protein [bacterium]
MKIPPLDISYYLGMQKRKNIPKAASLPPSLPPLQKDTVSFSSSTAYYLKKYNTLPSEIKKLLSPQDAIDMFKDMEMVQKGIVKRTKVGQGNDSRVYENPWLKDYYSLIVQNPQKTTQVVYSRLELGDSIWSDSDNNLIQIIKKAG